MLDALRRGANSWVLKPLLLLLVLAFIVWGVADVFTGFRMGSLESQGLAQAVPVDLAGVLEVNSWNGVERAQFRLKGLRPSVMG